MDNSEREMLRILLKMVLERLDSISVAQTGIMKQMLADRVGMEAFVKLAMKSAVEIARLDDPERKAALELFLKSLESTEANAELKKQISKLETMQEEMENNTRLLVKAVWPDA